MNAEIKAFEQEAQHLRLVLRKMEKLRDEADSKVKEAVSALTETLTKLHEAKNAADRKLPQCKIVRLSYRRENAVDACIVGVTPSGMLKVREIGFGKAELFKLARAFKRYESRGGSRWNKDYLRDVPLEFMPESAQ